MPARFPPPGNHSSADSPVQAVEAGGRDGRHEHCLDLPHAAKLALQAQDVELLAEQPVVLLPQALRALVAGQVAAPRHGSVLRDGQLPELLFQPLRQLWPARPPPLLGHERPAPQGLLRDLGEALQVQGALAPDHRGEVLELRRLARGAGLLLAAQRPLGAVRGRGGRVAPALRAPLRGEGRRLRGRGLQLLGLGREGLRRRRAGRGGGRRSGGTPAPDVRHVHVRESLGIRHLGERVVEGVVHSLGRLRVLGRLLLRHPSLLLGRLGLLLLARLCRFLHLLFLGLGSSIMLRDEHGLRVRDAAVLVPVLLSRLASGLIKGTLLRGDVVPPQVRLPGVVRAAGGQAHVAPRKLREPVDDLVGPLLLLAGLDWLPPLLAALG
mmetsp:Transcript_103105/g.269200  ORF Transcript_103105/g.269200 Transcript_103105/m.269200 type:complete len:381 (-) Transcript_103105:507-1649(-)